LQLPSVVVSEARTIREAGARGRVEPSRECILDHAVPGSSTETASFCCRNSFQGKRKMHARELPESCMAQDISSGCFDFALVPASGTRAPVSTTDQKSFVQTKSSPQLLYAFQ